MMTKKQIVTVLAGVSGITTKQCLVVLDGLVQMAYREAEHGFKIPGLCRFRIVERKGRNTRNPRTGEMKYIPRHRILKVEMLRKIREDVETPVLPAVPMAPPIAEAPPVPGPDIPPPVESRPVFLDCPHCGCEVEADESQIGMQADCPACGRSLLLDRGRLKADAGGASADARTVVFRCGSCDQEIEAEAVHAGRSAQCPSCGNRLTIPGESETPEPPSQPQGGDKEDEGLEGLSKTIRINLPPEDLLPKKPEKRVVYIRRSA